MKHYITLNSPWFELVQEGKKLYEGRRRTEKIKIICVDDILVIKHHTDSKRPEFEVKVVQIIEFPTFEDALKKLPINEILPLDEMSVEKGVEVYQQYVSLKTQINDGVTLFKVSLISDPSIL